MPATSLIERQLFDFTLELKASGERDVLGLIWGTAMPLERL